MNDKNVLVDLLERYFLGGNLR